MGSMPELCYFYIFHFCKLKISSSVASQPAPPVSIDFLQGAFGEQGHDGFHAKAILRTIIQLTASLPRMSAGSSNEDHGVSSLITHYHRSRWPIKMIHSYPELTANLYILAVKFQRNGLIKYWLKLNWTWCNISLFCTGRRILFKVVQARGKQLQQSGGGRGVLILRGATRRRRKELPGQCKVNIFFPVYHTCPRPISTQSLPRTDREGEARQIGTNEKPLKTGPECDISVVKLVSFICLKRGSVKFGINIGIGFETFLCF